MKTISFSRATKLIDAAALILRLANEMYNADVEIASKMIKGHSVPSRRAYRQYKGRNDR